MDKNIAKEQKKLAEHLKNLSADERQRQGFGMMCWLQGYEVGYQSAKSREKSEENG